MAPTCPARQTAGRESLQDWLVRPGIDVATFCDTFCFWRSEVFAIFIIAMLFLVGPAEITTWLPNDNM